MAFKFSKMQLLPGILARRVLLRILVFVLAIATVFLWRFISDSNMIEILVGTISGRECGRNYYPGRFLEPFSFYPSHLPGATSPLSSASSSCNGSANLTSQVFRELRDKKILISGARARALCLGKGSAYAVSVLQELGFASATAVGSHLFSSLSRKGLDYKLPFEDKSFDFVFYGSVDRAAITALLVLEMERVLKPSSFGVVLIQSISTSYSGTIFKVAAPISSFLKGSEIVHAYQINVFTLVAFKKQADDRNCTEELFRHLPKDCQSITNKKNFMEYLEPLVKEKPVRFGQSLSYLPKFMDISIYNNFIYIDVGAGWFLNSSIANWFLPFYPMQSQAFDIYAVDGDMSLSTSYAERPGITFVHFLGLFEEQIAEITPEPSYLPNDASLHFASWFNETVAATDFVVLKMNVGRTGLRLLGELVRSRALCFIDELFLQCPITSSSQNTVTEECFQFIKVLRSSGVFVHQW